MKSTLILDCVRATMFTLLALVLTKSVIAIDYRALNTFQTITSRINYTDLFFSNFYENKEVDTSIVIVNIADAGRAEISDLLNVISVQKPSVIGLDVSFDGKKDSLVDANLVKAINACGNIVLPNFNNSDFTILSDSTDHVFMASNKLITNESGIVKFAPIEKDPNGYLFGQLIAKIYKPNLVFESKTKEINFFGDHNNFMHYEMSDIISKKNIVDFKNKIVLIGYAGETWADESTVTDRYFTPLDINQNRLILPPTSGIVIHANIVKNVRDNNFINVSSQWIDLAILFFLLLFSNFFFLRNFERLSIPFFLKCRLFQTILSAVLAYLFFLIFNIYRLKFGLVEWVIAIIASFELSMLYAFLMYYLGNKFGMNSYIYKKLRL